MNDLHVLLTREIVTVADLRRIYDQFKPDKAFPAACLSELEQLDNNLAWRAAWLLRELAREERLREADLLGIAGLADGQTHWLARMILCQLFSIEQLSEPARKLIYPFLLDCCKDRRALVRAWAVTALAPFAKVAIYRRSVNEILCEARKDQSKAVQARLRHILRRSGQVDNAASRSTLRNSLLKFQHGSRDQIGRR